MIHCHRPSALQSTGESLKIFGSFQSSAAITQTPAQLSVCGTNTLVSIMTTLGQSKSDQRVRALG